MARKLGRSDPFAPYPDLMDLCALRGWRVHLDWGKDGWTLDVFDNGDLIARGTSDKAPPHCYGELAAKCAAALAQSGRARL
jgi:hypothetical protein